MQINDIGTLKEYCKDEQSFEEVKEIIADLVEERNRKAQNLKLLESAIRDDYDAILITELNLEQPGPKIVYVNDGFCEMTGYSREEVIGETPRILQGPKTDQKVLDKLKKRLEQGRPFFGQTINYRKDGSEFVNQWDIHPLTDEEGNITYWVSYQHDISTRKRSEEFLVDQKVEFEQLREESQRTVVDVDLQGNIILANKSFRELVGYTKDELKQIKVWDLFPEKYRNSLKGRFEKADASFLDGQELQGVIRHREGLPIQVRGKTKVLDRKDQKILRCRVENISLEKRIMKTLEKRNKDYSKIVDRASEYSYKTTFEDNIPVFKIFSEEFPEVTGLAGETVIGQSNVEKFIHKDDISEILNHLRKVQEGHTSTCKYRIRTKEGEYIEVLDYGKPEWDNKRESVIAAHCVVSFDEAFKKAKAQP